MPQGSPQTVPPWLQAMIAHAQAQQAPTGLLSPPPQGMPAPNLPATNANTPPPVDLSKYGSYPIPPGPTPAPTGTTYPGGLPGAATTDPRIEKDIRPYGPFETTPGATMTAAPRSIDMGYYRPQPGVRGPASWGTTPGGVASIPRLWRTARGATTPYGG